MNIHPEVYEKLGAFYLGREYDLSAKQFEDELLLYDSKDLVTHGVVLGMTGSGKTGLCISLLEEAGLDGVPAIAIDPKGDIANLLLTFPDLAPEQFAPWVNPDDAARKGLSVEDYAAQQAELWRKGLGEWGQGPERIAALRERVDLSVYTPGSSAGLPVSILSSLDAPGPEVREDSELLAERVESTVSSLLSLIGIDADPMQDAEHVLLSNLFAQLWAEGRGLSLETLIQQIQVPPFDRIGVMDLETVAPEKERRALAMKFNNLLASPGFATWLSGEPLDIGRMLHQPDGRPRISIFSIAHLSDAERMFFVSLLLNQTVSWMRTQSGTSSLRALLYMDEIFGYLPPTANPPSKKPMMTLLKQARAFGLGTLLATQNPVDLDYKALSNIGTWFLGRLQTERDMARVLDGLAGAAAASEGGFDRSAMERQLAALGSRVFLMNNVHDGAPTTFHVRWVMSYLCGPLTRQQLKALAPREDAPPASGAEEPQAGPPTSGSADPTLDDSVRDEKGTAAAATSPPPLPASQEAPRLPRGAVNRFLPQPTESADGGAGTHYLPMAYREAVVRYDDRRKGIEGERRLVQLGEIDRNTGEVRWNPTGPLPGGLSPTQLGDAPREGAGFEPLHDAFLKSTTFTAMKKAYVDELYSNQSITLFHAPHSDLYSRFGEGEGEFRARLVHEAREARDRAVEDLRGKQAKRLERLKASVQRAIDEVEEQEGQAGRAKVDSAVRLGGTILSAVLGRALSRKTSSTMNSASRAWKESRDVARAREALERAEEELEEAEAEAVEELEKLEAKLDPLTMPLAQERLSPLKKNIRTEAVGVLWVPEGVSVG